MLGSLLRTLRQPRYAALTALMLVVAAACVAAGSWQVARLKDKADTNRELRDNAHAPAAAVTDVLTTVGAPGGPVPGQDVEFRTVRATGTYDADHQALVRQRSVEDETGYLVLTPLRTGGGTLLVVRGFIPYGTQEGTPAIPAPPVGEVTVLARAHPGERRHDQAGQLPQPQLASINPTDQASRLDARVFDGYAVLEPGQPGVAPLAEIPAPDLSNPAGGAVEPQHIAYVIQWFLFAILALAAPVAMARSESRQQVVGDLDEQGPVMLTPEQARAAKLADRYGRTVH